MACYCGVALFEYQPEVSIYRRPYVSNLADKTLKSLLHLGAKSAIRLKNDLGEYYRRKVAEGKNKISVINAVRNKIIQRIMQ
jgi:transposase